MVAALLRELAKDPDEDGIGKGARDIADTLIGLARGVIDRTDGPGREEIDVSAEVTTKRVVLEREPPQ